MKRLYVRGKLFHNSYISRRRNNINYLILLDFLSVHGHWTMILLQVVAEFLVWRLGENSFLPKVWCQVGVSCCNGSVRGFGKVTKGASRASSRCVAIFNTSHLQKLLWYWSRYNTSTTGSWNQSYPNGSTLTGNLEKVSKMYEAWGEKD